MSNPVTKKTKRRLVFIILATLAVMGLIGFYISKTWFQIIDKNKEAKLLANQIAKLEDNESYLKGEVEKLQDPDYVARYAREKYLYSKDGEFTIRIP